MVRLWKLPRASIPRAATASHGAMILRGLALIAFAPAAREVRRSPTPAEELAAGAPAGLEDLFFRETISLVHQAMESLDAADCDCLRAALFRPETIAEYAEALGLSTGTLKVRIHRAMQRLRALLQPITEP